MDWINWINWNILFVIIIHIHPLNGHPIPIKASFQCSLENDRTWLCKCSDSNKVFNLHQSRDFFIVCGNDKQMNLMRSAGMFIGIPSQTNDREESKKIEPQEEEEAHNTKYQHTDFLLNKIFQKENNKEKAEQERSRSQDEEKKQTTDEMAKQKQNEPQNNEKTIDSLSKQLKMMQEKYRSMMDNKANKINESQNNQQDTDKVQNSGAVLDKTENVPEVQPKPEVAQLSTQKSPETTNIPTTPSTTALMATPAKFHGCRSNIDGKQIEFDHVERTEMTCYKCKRIPGLQIGYMDRQRCEHGYMKRQK